MLLIKWLLAIFFNHLSNVQISHLQKGTWITNGSTMTGWKIISIRSEFINFPGIILFWMSETPSSVLRRLSVKSGRFKIHFRTSTNVFCIYRRATPPNIRVFFKRILINRLSTFCFFLRTYFTRRNEQIDLYNFILEGEGRVVIWWPAFPVDSLWVKSFQLIVYFFFFLLNLDWLPWIIFLFCITLFLIQTLEINFIYLHLYQISFLLDWKQWLTSLDEVVYPAFGYILVLFSWRIHFLKYS